MSQKMLNMVQDLMRRVSSLEERLEGLEERSPPPSNEFTAFHGGFGRWQVKSPQGVNVGTEWMSKEDALSLAEDMNMVTEGIG